jgi:hypothetical protein
VPARQPRAPYSLNQHRIHRTPAKGLTPCLRADETGARALDKPRSFVFGDPGQDCNQQIPHKARGLVDPRFPDGCDGRALAGDLGQVVTETDPIATGAVK